MVGCGYTYYDDPKRGFSKLYVCNYGPGGNLVGGSMYRFVEYLYPMPAYAYIIIINITLIIVIIIIHYRIAAWVSPGCRRVTSPASSPAPATAACAVSVTAVRTVISNTSLQRWPARSTPPTSATACSRPPSPRPRPRCTSPPPPPTCPSSTR